MDIGPVNNRYPDPQPNRKSQPDKPAEEQANARAEDRVEISFEARERLAELADKARALEAQNETVEGPDGNERTNSQTPGKASNLDEIRARIESGYYNRPEIMDRIVDRLSDDIES